MNKCGLRKFVAALVALAATIVAFAPAAFAQGCVMCYTSASAAGKRGEHALDKAILVLLIPPLLLFVGILIFAFRRSHASSARAAATRPTLFVDPLLRPGKSALFVLSPAEESERPARTQIGERVEGPADQPVLRFSFLARLH